MVFPQRCLCSGISTMKGLITLEKKRLFTVLFLMILAAFAGACGGTSMVTRMLWTAGVPQVLLGKPAADLESLRNTLALSWKNMNNMQQLRDELASLAAEINTVKKEAQQMREAMSAITEMSGWAVKNTGTAIKLQRSSSSSTLVCRVFWLLWGPPILDTFVQPDSSPGYCWPFQGSQSEVLIELPAKIRPAAITVQHTLKTDSPLRAISSAPRDFTVSGLDEEGKDETLLGTFTYAAQEEVIQTFPLQDEMRDFRFLKLVVQNNWGKPGYTCIYRVQVHGKVDGTSAISQISLQ